MSGTIVVAYARSNRVIGRAGRLPWDLPAERAHFRDLTMGGIVVLGRKTWEALPTRPLPGRYNVVVTRRRGITFRRAGPADGTAWDPSACDVPEIDDPLVVHDALGDPLYWIGGAELYRSVLDRGLANRIVASEIPGDYEGDAHFPELGAEWREVRREAREGFEVVEFDRRKRIDGN